MPPHQIFAFPDWCKLKRRMTWNNAKNTCSQSNTTLLDHTDSDNLKYITNIVMRSRNSRGIWIGLKKNVTNVTAVLGSDLLKVELCQAADIEGNSFRNVSCTSERFSVCVKKKSKKKTSASLVKYLYLILFYLGACKFIFACSQTK